MTQDSTDGWYAAETATFGDRLAAGREAAGMTQAQLAKRVGVKLATLRGWEDDLSEPRANQLQTLCGILTVSLPWLLTGEGDGVQAPGEAGELSQDVAGLLTELRALRTELSAGIDRLGVLEKRLRATLKKDA